VPGTAAAGALLLGLYVHTRGPIVPAYDRIADSLVQQGWDQGDPILDPAGKKCARLPHACTKHLKLEGSPVIGTRIPAVFSPRETEARIGFRLRRDEDIHLDIADSQGTIVKHGIGSGVFGQAYHQFASDGRDDSARSPRTGHPPLRLPVPSQAERYRLTVTANAHRARATVVVRPNRS